MMVSLLIAQQFYAAAAYGISVFQAEDLMWL